MIILPDGGPLDPLVVKSRALLSLRGSDWQVADSTSKGIFVRSGQVATFVRTGLGTAFDGRGRIRTPPHSCPRRSWWKGSPGLDECLLPVEASRVNLCPDSDLFNAWTDIGTPTRVAAALKVGDLLLELLGDDAAGTLEGKSKVCVFTGNGAKTVSVHVAAGGTSTSSVLRLRDTTAAADRLLATITWSGSVPQVAMSTGTFLGRSPQLANGAYRLYFTTSAVTAANNNQAEIYPATTNALAVGNTGTLYVGGVQAENAVTPSTYLRTSGGTGTRAVESLSIAIGWIPQALSAYVRFLFLDAIADGVGYLNIGGGGTPVNERFVLLSSGSFLRAHHETAAGAVTSTLAAAPAWGDLVELLGVLKADGSCYASQRINGGPIATAAVSGAQALGSTWGAATVELGRASAALAGVSWFDKVTILGGDRSMDELASYF